MFRLNLRLSLHVPGQVRQLGARSLVHVAADPIRCRRTSVKMLNQLEVQQLGTRRGWTRGAGSRRSNRSKLKAADSELF